jgi:aminodeoxyfutalosine deaminase
MTLETYLRAAPKAELHVHLEGSIQPATLLTLARRNRVELPVASEAGLRDWLVYRDFNHFIEIYVTISSCLKTAEDYNLITYEFGAEMARQNVRYAEVTFTPSTHYLRLGVSHDIYASRLPMAILLSSHLHCVIQCGATGGPALHDRWRAAC